MATLSERVLIEETEASWRRWVKPRLRTFSMAESGPATRITMLLGQLAEAPSEQHQASLAESVAAFRKARGLLEYHPQAGEG